VGGISNRQPPCTQTCNFSQSCKRVQSRLQVEFESGQVDPRGTPADGAAAAGDGQTGDGQTGGFHVVANDGWRFVLRQLHGNNTKLKPGWVALEPRKAIQFQVTRTTVGSGIIEGNTPPPPS
jgi:hypothetical protein